MLRVGAVSNSKGKLMSSYIIEIIETLLSYVKMVINIRVIVSHLSKYVLGSAPC